MKNLLQDIMERLVLCEDIADSTERNLEYKACCSKLTELSERNKANPDPEITSLLSQAYILQREAKAVCSAPANKIIEGFVKTDGNIDSSIYGTRIRKNIFAVETRIKSMKAEASLQGKARGLLLSVCNLKIKAVNADGKNVYKETQVISENHPEIKKLWALYTLTAIEENEKYVNTTKDKEMKTPEEVRKLEKIVTEALPRLYANKEKKGL